MLQELHKLECIVTRQDKCLLVPIIILQGLKELPLTVVVLDQIMFSSNMPNHFKKFKVTRLQGYSLLNWEFDKTNFNIEKIKH